MRPWAFSSRVNITEYTHPHPGDTAYRAPGLRCSLLLLGCKPGQQVTAQNTPRSSTRENNAKRDTWCMRLPLAERTANVFLSEKSILSNDKKCSRVSTQTSNTVAYDHYLVRGLYILHVLGFHVTGSAVSLFSPASPQTRVTTALQPYDGYHVARWSGFFSSIVILWTTVGPLWPKHHYSAHDCTLVDLIH